MITVFNKDKNRIPIKMWLSSPDDLEQECMKQVNNLSNLAFAFKHIAILPDAHTGYGMPIGGVLAAKGVIIPNAVGVDIGCGMIAVKTSLNSADYETLKKILRAIRMVVPLGFEHHKKAQDNKWMPLKNGDYYPIIDREFLSAKHQVGTLGGGNHFLELQKGNDGFIWFMIHSGSRNLGKKVADYHNQKAKITNEKKGFPVPKEFDLAPLYVDTQESETYIDEMRFCLDFAASNRKLMAERLKEIIGNETSASFAGEVHIHHNYAAFERHFGEDVVVHRKGATSAKLGELGIIPGSQGAKSYIVRGKGNVESFMSCSHGAGRRMGRKQAQRALDLEDEKRKLDEKGIIHSIRTVRDLDESASAYKDINVVMSNQKDLVDILVELSPLAVVKG
ncbi:MAG: RtcB family protein [Elusimicrobiota bacterium]